MATAKQNPATKSPWRRRMLMLGIALVLALLGFFWRPLNGYAEAGAAYGARVACSCRFVGGRSLGDCRKDFEPGMELVTLSEDVQAKSVTASFPLLASHTATYREGPGCQLEAWPD
ncbi:MAG: hypothetical protein J0M19_06335 [Sphingomonadales bacterium]|nr:hypothetical protein [Sphingomonadales bacterium]